MLDKITVMNAIEETREILKNMPEPDRSLSFSIVLSKALEAGGQTVVAKIVASTTTEDGEVSFSGLRGGMRLLVQEGFFKEGRTQGEIFEELKRQGYHYPKTSLPAALQAFLSKRTLTRVAGDDSQWRYVERK
jgi:hypothetical protein